MTIDENRLRLAGRAFPAAKALSGKGGKQSAGIFTCIAAACMLSACENTLIYAERTGFNLAVQVNDDPATPLQVNAGLKRTVVGLVPPSKTTKHEDNSSSADGDAVSMFSGFRLEYEEGTSAFQGDLTIRTQFASGMAARQVAANDPTGAAVSKIVNVPSATSSNTETVQRIRAWLASNSNNLALLKQWVAENAPEVGLTFVRFGAEYEDQRRAAIDDLNIPPLESE